MNFNKIKKVIFCLIVLFTIYKTINYFEWIKNKMKIEEIRKQNEEYIKNLNNLVTKFKNRLLELEKDSEKTLQELVEVKEDNIKTHQELAEIKEAMKSMMSLMQKGLT